MDTFKVYGACIQNPSLLIKEEKALLDFSTSRSAVDPAYASIPNESTLEAAKTYNAKFYTQVVGSDSDSKTDQAREWTIQVPKHCLCLWIDILSMILGLEQKNALQLLVDTTISLGLEHELRASVAHTLSFLLGNPQPVSILPFSILIECIKAWNAQRYYQLLCIQTVMDFAASYSAADLPENPGEWKSSFRF